jgi:glyoxylase-like metal-dependent hydrolase (beta-lactamase superfamily II)
MKSLPSWLTPIALPMPATRGSVNVYLIRTSTGTALIDTGFKDDAVVRMLEKILHDGGLGFKDIDQVVLTHHHVDHTGLAARLQRDGATVYLSKREADLMFAFKRFPEKDDERARFHAGHPMPETLVAGVKTAFDFMRRIGDVVRPDHDLVPDERIAVAGIPFRVLSTAGHTPGHIALVDENEEILFTGDCLLNLHAVHITDHSGAHGKDPYDDYQRSLERLGAMQHGVACPGHGRPITDIPATVSAISMTLAAELCSVEGRLGHHPQSAFELTLKREGHRDRALPIWLALSKTVACLTHLAARNRAKIVETSNGPAYTKP